MRRVVCQDPSFDTDIEWIAVGGKAYSAGLADASGASPRVLDGLVVAGVFRDEADGTFAVTLSESLPAPSVSAIPVPATVKARALTNRASTLSGPAPAGGMSLYLQATPGYLSIGRVRVPAGATRGPLTMNLGSASASSSPPTRVGAPVTATTVVT